MKTVLLFEQGTDEAIAHRLVSKPEQRVLLKLNSLFFDVISIRAPDLLSNKCMQTLWDEEPDGAEALYKGVAGKAGVLRPWLGIGTTGMRSVAEAMTAPKKGLPTIHYAGSKLSKHAELVDKARPIFIRGPYQHHANLYQEYVRLLVTNACSNGIPDPDSTDSMFPTGSLRAFDRWLDKQGSFSNSDVARFLESSEEPAIIGIKKRIYWMTHAAQQYSCARCIDNCVLSSAGQLRLFNAIMQKQDLGDIITTAEPLFKEAYDLTLPLHAIASLPVRKIMKLRERSIFRETRQVLNGLRLRKAHSGEGRLPELIRSCGEAIVDAAARHNKTRTQKFLQLGATTCFILGIGSFICVIFIPGIPLSERLKVIQWTPVPFLGLAAFGAAAFRHFSKEQTQSAEKVSYSPYAGVVAK